MIKELLNVLIAVLFIFGLSACSTIDDSVDKQSSQTVTHNQEEMSEEDIITKQGTNQYVSVQENQYLELFLNPDSTEVAVKDKLTGNMWYSNPVDREQDNIANGINKLSLASQLTADFYDATDKLIVMDNYSESIQRDQFESYKIDNGVKVYYTIGKMERFVIPQIISKERFENQILDKITEEADKATILRRYKLISLSSSDGSLKDQLLKQYPMLEKHDVYVIPSNLADFVKEELSTIVSATGYTLEEMKRDHEENGVAVASALSVTIPIVYALDGINLVVKVPVGEIVYDEELYKLHKLNVLNFFGAANQQKEGYMLVPDGSGALITLNNGKTKYPSYSKQLYGRDKSIYVEDVSQKEQQAYLPVFGMKQDDQAFFAIIEEGDAVAQINADIAGRFNGYNSVSASFIIRPTDKLYLSFAKNNGMNTYQPIPLQGDIKLRYTFLSGDHANYSGMARYYQDYLVDSGLIKKVESGGATALHLDLVGGVDQTKSIAGIPMKTLKPITTYSDAQTILEALYKNGVENIALRYSGWSNGGLMNSIYSNIEIEGKLGGKKAFKELQSYADYHGFEIYPDIDFLYVGKNSWFDSFNESRDTARFLTGGVAVNYPYDIATKKADEDSPARRFIISPGRLSSFVETFLDNHNRSEIDNISLSSLGSDINSDFRRGHPIDRQQAKEIIAQQFQAIKAKELDVLVDGGNAFVLPYTDRVLNVPLESSQYYITDKSIPFYQMILHGIVPYSGTPMNLADDRKTAWLKSVETGSSLLYKWMFEENSELKDTLYQSFSLNYKPWIEEAIQLYNEYNQIFSSLKDQRMMEHREIADQVYRVTYEDGTFIVVNYNYDVVIVDGLEVQGQDYVVIEKGEGNR